MSAPAAAPGLPALKHQPFPVFFDPGALPWTEWTMPRTWFKLLNVDLKTGGFSMLLKVDADNEAPIHRHIGGIEGYLIEGDFGYDDDCGTAGCYVWENGGAVHSPTTRNGFIMFAIVYGPVVGYDEDGRIAGIVDAELMLELARANDAASHIRI